MTGLVRKATLLLSVCGLLAAGAAFASVPDPGNSSFNKGNLNMVGSDGVSVSGFSPFTVNVKDLAGNPIQGSVVVLDFTACSDVQFCSDQLGNSTADCPTHTVRKATDVSGNATFNILGGQLTGDADGSDCNCVVIYADGVNIVETLDEPVNCGLYDLNNVGGVGGADLSLWLTDFGSTLNPPRADYNHAGASPGPCGAGAVGGADLSLWLSAFGSATMGNSCAASKCTP